MSKVVAEMQQTQGVARLIWVFIVTVVLYNMVYGVATLKQAANSASILNRVLDGAEEAAMDGDTLSLFFKNKFVDEFLDPSGEVRLRAMAAGGGGVESDLRCRYSPEEKAVVLGIASDTELVYDSTLDTCVTGNSYTYKGAAAACAAQNMTLPIVHSAAENKALQRIDPHRPVWLGARSNHDGFWEWEDGTKLSDGFTYSNTMAVGQGRGFCLKRSHESWRQWGWYSSKCTDESDATGLICQDSNVKDLAKRYVLTQPQLPAKMATFHNRTHGDIALWLNFDLGRAVDSSRNRLEVEPWGEILLKPSRIRGRIALCPPTGGLRLPGRPLALNMGCDGPGAIELGGKRRWCDANAAFTWETQLMPNPLSASSEDGSSAAAESVIFGQVRDPFAVATTVLTLRRNDSALFFFGSRVPGTNLPAHAWSHLAVTRTPDPGDANQTSVQLWINGTLRAKTKTDHHMTFELRELGSGFGECFDDVIVTRDNDGGRRPCGSYVCLNAMSELKSLTGTNIHQIGTSNTVAGNIAHLFSPAVMAYDPTGTTGFSNRITWRGAFKTTQDGIPKRIYFNTDVWFLNAQGNQGTEGPLEIGGGYSNTLGTALPYRVLVALLFVGMVILVNEFFFDVRSTQTFLEHFAAKSIFCQEEGGVRSQARDRAPSGLTMWQIRKQKATMSYAQALGRHFFDLKCNSPKNWLDTIVGSWCLVWGVSLMAEPEDLLGSSYATNLVAACFAFVLVAIWSLTYFRFHSGLSVFTSTVWYAGPDLVDTICVMGFLMLCFALATHSVMGLLGTMNAYVDLSHTFFTLGEMAFTGISFDNFSTEGRGKVFNGLGFDAGTANLKYFVFWTMVVIFTIVMANLLIAVISDAYEEARGDRDETQQRMSALHIVWRKAKSVVMTPLYAYWCIRGRKNDSVGYLRWQRDWFALTPGGLRLVNACTNPFTLAFTSHAAIFKEVNAEAKGRAGVAESLPETSDVEETTGNGEGSQAPVAAAGILGQKQLEMVINLHGDTTLKGVCAERLLALFGKTWTESDVTQRGKVVMEKWRRALPGGWRGASSTERGCARAVERSPKIIQMEKSMKIIPNLESDIRELKSDLQEIKGMLRALLDKKVHPELL